MGVEMNERDEIIAMARYAGIEESNEYDHLVCTEVELLAFAKLVAERTAAKEREALEAELLKLKQGVAANSDYIQGRWDLLGEFQDVIRARGEA